MPDKPPLKLRIIAKVIGGDLPKVLSTIWEKASGYKTYAGLLITLLAFLSTWLPDVLTAANVDPLFSMKISGLIITAVGFLHKAYKAIYQESAPGVK